MAVPLTTVVPGILSFTITIIIIMTVYMLLNLVRSTNACALMEDKSSYVYEFKSA